MIRRIVRSALVFAAIFVAYQAYALVAVPWMEPNLAARQQPASTGGGKQLARNVVTQYQLLLSNYFPKDHWTQTQPPKVIASSNEQAMLVLDDYDRHENGQVNIARFALLVFPTTPYEGITPPQDAIILEAPQGARLQFDGFRPERGQIGQITRGQFPGRVTIRSNMRDAGPDDDLLVETNDLEMRTRLLYTTSPVRFRLGPNVGSGRELEVRFLTDEHIRPSDSGFKIAGIDSLEIRRDVRLRLQLGTDSLLPGRQSRPDQGNKEQPPVEVSCGGPFHFDFVRYIAGMDRDVELRQINPNGPSDQLTCNQLDIHFAPMTQTDGKVDRVIVDPARRQQRELGRLEPAAIVAEGHPVVISSPAREAEARGERIQIGLRDRQLVISGGREVMLMYGPNVLRAPSIEYQHPADDAATSLGLFRATGPGSLRYVPNPNKPQQVLQATWQRSVELERDKGQPTLALEGRPQLAFSDSGALTADRIRVFLRELQGNSPTGVRLPTSESGATMQKLQVVPDRLAATGHVEIQSPQLTGRTSELLTTFRMQQVTAPVETTESAPANATAGAAAPRMTSPLSFSLSTGPAQQAFHIDAERMQIQVFMRGQAVVPASIACAGDVVFREVPLERTAEQPLEIRGGQLTVDQLDSGTARITLIGVNRGEAPGSKLAQLAGRGVTILVDVVEIDQHDNRLWSNGPGKATLLMTRSLEGRESTTPIPLDVAWQGGLQFDGRTLVFQRNVVIAGTDDTLRCDQLSARLSAPVQFGQAANRQAIELAEVDCRGRVSIDHRSRDAVGVTSHERAQLNWLTMNQQTGVITGGGPGALRSTRFGGGLAALSTPQSGSKLPIGVSPPPGGYPRGGGSKLHFLRLDFRDGLGGNLYTRELTFRGRVRTVYGPVDAWEQELDVGRPESLPPDSVSLACDELRVNEDPIAARAAAAPALGTDSRPLGPVQLQARDNVRIDGQSAAHGGFGAQANWASYDQAKDIFLLKGDPRQPATLWYAGQQGPPPRAREISYMPSTGKLKVDGLFFLEITPNDVESARREGTFQQ